MEQPGLWQEGLLLRVGNSLQPMDNFFKPKDRGLVKKSYIKSCVIVREKRP
jgi:hypothetical protein